MTTTQTPYFKQIVAITVGLILALVGWSVLVYRLAVINQVGHATSQRTGIPVTVEIIDVPQVSTQQNNGSQSVAQ
jgi:hypothetical protein